MVSALVHGSRPGDRVRAGSNPVAASTLRTCQNYVTSGMVLTSPKPGTDKAMAHESPSSQGGRSPKGYGDADSFRSQPGGSNPRAVAGTCQAGSTGWWVARGSRLFMLFPFAVVVGFCSPTPIASAKGHGVAGCFFAHFSCLRPRFHLERWRSGLSRRS